MNRMAFRGMMAGLLALALSAPAAAQRLGGGGAPEVPIVRIVGALFLCLLVAALAILYLRHRAGGAMPAMFGRLIKADPEIDVREVRRLTVQHSIGLVRHAGQDYLLLLSPGDGLLLDRRPVAADPRAEHGA